MSVPFPDLENDWLTILFFFLVLLLPYFLGEKAAKIPVLGFFAKKVQETQKNRRANRVLTAANIGDMVEQKVEEKVGQIRFEVELLADYLAYDASWHRRHDIVAGQEGWELPHPTHLNLQEWMSEKGVSWPNSHPLQENQDQDQED